MRPSRSVTTRPSLNPSSTFFCRLCGCPYRPRRRSPTAAAKSVKTPTTARSPSRPRKSGWVRSRSTRLRPSETPTRPKERTISQPAPVILPVWSTDGRGGLWRISVGIRRRATSLARSGDESRGSNRWRGWARNPASSTKTGLAPSMRVGERDRLPRPYLAQRLPQNLRRGGEEEPGHHGRDRKVGPGRPGQRHRARREHDRDVADRIVARAEPHGAHVRVAVLVAHQDENARHVGGEGEEPDAAHDLGLRHPEDEDAMDGRAEDPEAHQ